MSGNSKVIYDQGDGAQRLLDAFGAVSDASLELALDTDTKEKYDELAVKQHGMEESASADSSKGSWIQSLFKVAGVAAACFVCVSMMFTGGATDYVPDIDRTKPIMIICKKEQYRTIMEADELQDFGLEHVRPEDVLGHMVSYLRISGANEYENTRNMTQMILYTCQDREDVFILKDWEGYLFVVPVFTLLAYEFVDRNKSKAE